MRFTTLKNLITVENAFQIWLNLLPSKSKISILHLLCFISPLATDAEIPASAVYLGVFGPAAQFSEQKPLILHEHETSMTLFSQGCIGPLCHAGAYLAQQHPQSQTRTLRVILSRTISSQSPHRGLYIALLTVQFLACHSADDLKPGLHTHKTFKEHHWLWLNVCP